VLQLLELGLVCEAGAVDGVIFAVGLLFQLVGYLALGGAVAAELLLQGVDALVVLAVGLGDAAVGGVYGVGAALKLRLRGWLGSPRRYA
jgi:hypothetical protein